MTARGKAVLYGVLTTSVILLVALLITEPDGTTLLLAIAFGVVAAVTTWYQESRR